MIIRAAAVYFKGKKIAEIETAEYSIESGDEEVALTEGIEYTSGHIRTRLTCNTVVPVGGMTTTLEGALLAKQKVMMTWLGGGKLHQILMKPMSAKYSSDGKSGSLKGAFEFAGGTPEVN